MILSKILIDLLFSITTIIIIIYVDFVLTNSWKLLENVYKYLKIIHIV